MENLISLNYKGNPVLGLANFPILKSIILILPQIQHLLENGKKEELKLIGKLLFKYEIVSSFSWKFILTNKKIPQILKRMQFPCSDALSYSHFAEGKLDIVIQCGNKFGIYIH